MSREAEARPVARSDAAMIDRYLAMLAAERGAARNTLLAYRNDLEDAAGRLGNLAEAEGAGLAVLSQAWASLSASSLARKSSALRGFFAFWKRKAFARTIPRQHCRVRRCADRCPRC